MKLTFLSLKHYRNYEQLELSFREGVHIFLGENAQGKTNLMEAIYVLAMARSHRTSHDKELIQWDKESALLKGTIQKNISNVSLELSLSKKGKAAKVNYLEQKKMSSYLGNMNVVLFAPEDLNLIKGSPSVRRKFIDMELGQMNPVYLHDLVKYQKVLKQRNTYLKQLAFKKTLDSVYLEVLTDQLAELGASILHHRFRFIDELQQLAYPIHRAISNEKEELTISYVTKCPVQKEMSILNLKEQLSVQFEQVYKRELDQATTLVGPHRDDIAFFINGYDVQLYGSQGQQRSTVLSMKLAEIELIYQVTNEYPILLLDDVLSELDDDRQTHLIQAIENKVQTFLTTTNLDGIKKQFIKQPTIFHIEKGIVITNGA